VRRCADVWFLNFKAEDQAAVRVHSETTATFVDSRFEAGSVREVGSGCGHVVSLQEGSAARFFGCEFSGASDLLIDFLSHLPVSAMSITSFMHVWLLHVSACMCLTRSTTVSDQKGCYCIHGCMHAGILQCCG
jgi:hypothetical protein